MGFKISEHAIYKYLQRRLDDLSVLKKARIENDYSCIQHIAHQIRGNASTFGFSDLGDQASLLEDSAINKNDVELSTQIKKFEKWIIEKTTNLPLQTQK